MKYNITKNIPNNTNCDINSWGDTLSGKEYAFTMFMEEMDAELDASEVYKLVKEEAWREYKRTGRNTLIF